MAKPCAVIGIGQTKYKSKRIDVSLEGLVREAALRALADATIQPETIESASAVFVVAASFWRSRFKYGQRALRFVLIEAGHAMQNMVLAATSLGLTHRPIGGFYDDEVADVIGLDGVNEAPLYILPVGRPIGRTP